jgi:citrate lyase subunit beta/citryl-CoA lyase
VTGKQLDFMAPIFVPADRPERFEKAAGSGADAVIIDLEDAVGAEAKTAARANLRTDFTDLPVLVRINAAGTRWHQDDLAVVSKLSPDAILLPKAEFNAELEKLCSQPPAALPVMALIETARGLADARTIAALPAVRRLAFGSIDFCADAGCAHTREALLLARCELVLASRLAGKHAPLDGVTASIDHFDAVLADTRHCRDLGFSGKLCIHPKQIGAVLDGFRPADSEIAWARKALEAGPGAVGVDGAMVDEPVRLRARAILQRARQLRAS